MPDLCTDNRFELIEKYRQRLIEATNIETSQDDMKALDGILFRFWQMGWLDRLENDAPTFDPVRHGYWKETDDPMFRACSVCGYLEWRGLWNNYCPECGAKMDGGEE